MPFKRILYFFLAALTVAVLLTVLWGIRFSIRRIALEKAAENISRNFLHGMEYEIDHAQRKVLFAGKEVDFLKKHKLHGRITFCFPVKFFELPWNVNLERICVDGVHWELDLQKRTLNGFERDVFLNSIRKELETFKQTKNKRYPAFLTSGTLTLINPEGKSRNLAIKSIFQELKGETYLLGIHAGDMKVNFFHKNGTAKIVGQYQAKQSDFEFIRLSFGIPELFDMHGVDKLAGEFRYDMKLRKIDFIRGSSNFGLQSSIKGSVFTLYGNRLGRIYWEYLNPQNWQIELRNAVSATPVRAGLHYFVLSQNTLEKDALSFDGEIEFNLLSFKNMFGLELDRRTSNIRHRIVGKWDMVRKTWELSRLETQKRVPQVKLKWNDSDIAFQWQNFKLSGRGDQADHFGFHYELDMSNFDWKDKNNNALIGTQAKLEGDCILSLADDTLKPVSTGKFSCSVADGVIGKSRFLVNNAFLNFAPDIDGKTKYYFACGDLKVGIPDLRNGWICAIHRLEGAWDSKSMSVSSPSLDFKYRNELHLSGNKWFAERKLNEKNIRFELSPMSGMWQGKKLQIDKIAGEIINNGKNIYLDGSSKNVIYDVETLKADSVKWSIESGFPFDNNVLCRRFMLKPEKLQVKTPWLETDIVKPFFNLTFNDKQIWYNWSLEAGKSKIKYKEKEYTIPGLTAGEFNHGKYCDGLLKNSVLPYQFDISYTRKKSDITLKTGRLTFNGNVLWGLTGDVKLQKNDNFLDAKMQYAEFKIADMAWENGVLSLIGNKRNGFEINDFSGTSSLGMSKVRYIGRNNRSENEFEVKNFSARYIEKTLGVPENSFNGMFDGKITTASKNVFNPFNIQTFYLKNNQVMRLRLGTLEKFAGKGNSVEDDFATDALKDFFAKTLTLDYHRVGDYMVLNVNTLGKSTELLPYEYDIKEKKLKKSDIALFNSEVEVSMKYMIKKP